MRIINLTEYGQYPSYAHRTRRFNSFIQNSKGNKSVPGFTSFEMDTKRLERPTTQNNINFLIIKLQNPSAVFKVLQRTFSTNQTEHFSTNQNSARQI